MKVHLCKSLFETFVLHNNDLSLLLEVVNLLNLMRNWLFIAANIAVSEILESTSGIWVIFNIDTCILHKNIFMKNVYVSYLKLWSNAKYKNVQENTIFSSQEDSL